MDPISIISIVFGITAILASAMWEGTSLLALMNAPAAFIIAGGTSAATITCYTLEEIMQLTSTMRLITAKKKFTEEDIFSAIGEMATLARREGLLALENQVSRLDILLFKRGVRLVVDGTEPTLLKDLLVSQLLTQEERIKTQAGILQTAGGFAPTMGIIGTVMGLVNVLGNLSNPDELGHLIAGAFLATLYGIGVANVLLLPLGKKLTFVAKEQVQQGLLIIEGLIAIQSGDNPRTAEEKLLSLVEEKHWEHLRRKQAPAK